MKRLFGAALISTLILVPAGAVKSQYDGISPGDNRQQGLTQQQQQILQNNQDLNYRTNQQIFNRRVNNALSECSQPGASSSCQRAVPQAESWKTNGTVQDLQDLRFRSIQGEQ